ncbi:MAG: alpha-glucuronidase family glycosyl hydrolase [Cyclobacteriaceae bacterium]
MRKFLILIILSLPLALQAEDGYRLWLRYDRIADDARLTAYRQAIQGWLVEGNSPTLSVVEEELRLGLNGLLDQEINVVSELEDNILLIGTPATSPLIASLKIERDLSTLGSEGYLIMNKRIDGKNTILIAANEDVGVLYGVFHFLRLLQTQQDISQLTISENPKLDRRLLNHWDNLDRTVERGYAGFSIWDWHRLPEYKDPRYTDYARANASLGINGTVITNVNANALILTPHYLEKVAALADIFRPYGIKVYLTARFSAPVELRELETADPLNPEVQAWWKKKADEIYEYVPDFGGFLVKANSEGQPGPQDYDRNHADGANMLADAVAEHGGIVMWRAFVYSEDEPLDRAKQAYDEFKPLDGQFRDNVMVQVKNGAIDFQPREPFHPLFGAMPETPLMMEFQITQEYLGQATNLVYLSSLFEEVLDADTHAKGEGSTVAKVIDGSLHGNRLTGIAGVANIGTDRNWTGHLFGQSNWYAYGRLAWDPYLSSEEIAGEWIGMTFSNDAEVVRPIKNMMLQSHEAVVNYMTPLGLHHIMGPGHHYGPGPWVAKMSRADWTSVYYHKADEEGIGFDRTAKGSNAVEQYFPPVEQKFASLESCPEKFLLWFHHLDWDYELNSGRTLWEGIAYHYQMGVDSVRQMQQTWNSLESHVDAERFEQVQDLLEIQEKEAVWWKNACLIYFQQFSQRPIPEGVEKPKHSLEYYESLRFPYAPGIRPSW